MCDNVTFATMSRSELQTSDFTYDLPDERIAKFPLKNRNASKLLLYQNGAIEEDTFANLQDYLPEDTLLVFNDTRVIAARLHFVKKTGAEIEVFCLEPYESTVEQALTSTKKCIWQCMVGNLRRFKTDDILELQIAGVTLKASIVERQDHVVIVKFEWEGGIEFSSILNDAGEMPLPPYLNREAEKEDEQNYQTVYARNEGAVAAPTAGLHFVDAQLDELQKKGHDLAYLTLYVGAGTFRSVKAAHLVDHDMHYERIVLNKSTIAQLAKEQRHRIAVGTTSLRSLESLYWLAVKMNDAQSDEVLSITQDDAYQLQDYFTWHEACEFIIEFLEKTGKDEIDFRSALFIMPGYRWQAIQGLITNFHQPKSTLLSLVSAWIGDDWKSVYEHALKNDFRFLSYGDSSLLFRNERG